MYRIAYNIPGFLPESDSVLFDDIDDARSYIRAEWERGAEDIPEWEQGESEDFPGDWNDAAMRTLASIDALERGDHVGDPVPGSGRRWFLDEVSHVVRCKVNIECRAADFDDADSIASALERIAERVRNGEDCGLVQTVNGARVGDWSATVDWEA